MLDYYTQLKRYYDHFPREQLHIIVFENLVNDPKPVLEKLWDFLDIDGGFEAVLTQSNKATVARSKALVKLMSPNSMLIKWVYMPIMGIGLVRKVGQFIYRANLREGEISKFTPQERVDLALRFRPMIKRTEELTGLDLENIWI